MKPVPSCRTRIDVQAVDGRVVHHPQQVRMSRYEQLRRFGIDGPPDACIILARIATNVLHQHIHLLTLPPIRFREADAHIAAIDIAIHRPQRRYLCQAVRHLHGADIASMPDFVTILEILRIALVPASMRVRQQSDSSHRLNPVTPRSIQPEPLAALEQPVHLLLLPDVSSAWQYSCAPDEETVQSPPDAPFRHCPPAQSSLC